MNRRRAECDELTPYERASRLGRAGRPTLGIQIARRRAGEVLARGNVIMAGYWEQPDETAAAMGDGWFHTGDGGHLDDEGYLTISDRKKDVIISGGENVSSIEVEDALFSHPAVAEVAVIGVPDEKWGETVTALVVLAPGAHGHRGRADRVLPRPAGPLQVPQVDRVPRRAGPHRHRQAAEVQAARAVLGRARPPRELTRHGRDTGAAAPRSGLAALPRGASLGPRGGTLAGARARANSKRWATSRRQSVAKSPSGRPEGAGGERRRAGRASVR